MCVPTLLTVSTTWPSGHERMPSFLDGKITGRNGTPRRRRVGYLSVADLFDVLADDTRRDILLLLRSSFDAQAVKGNGQPGELSVGDLVDRLGITQPTVSKHLKVLREHHVVDVREDGQHRYYRLAPGPLGSVRHFLDDVAPQPRPAGVDASPETPYVDLWPAGFQIGTWVAQAREAIERFLGNVRP